jgi:aminopeptidase N
MYMTKSVRRLSELFKPAHYNLSLDISQRTQRVFSGSVSIEGELLHTGMHIALHAKELSVTKATIDGAEAELTKDANDELLLGTGHNIQAGTHRLSVEFNSVITDPMHGIYPCYFTQNGKPKELLMTQLESHSAREVFPCIDEPAAKATFQLTLVTEPDVTTLSNTPIKSDMRDGNKLVTTFEPTPKMSTYLLAFVVGKLVHKETTNQHGVKIRVYATPNHKDELEFSLHNAARFLDFYDDFFGTPYPLPKCDLVACPDFAAGAMENWGLLTFREAALLVNHDTSADLKQHIAGVVSHELAHQWFGDLVTMQWWDHLWLNESFANYMETYVPAHFYPEWQLWEQYTASEQQYALGRDGLASVQAVQQHVNHPDEIAALFDPAIVYAKGGSLIRMVHDYLGDESFRAGLRLYMKRHKYGNTTTDDLWRAWAETSGKDVETFMHTWISKPGHPVVEANFHDGHATISQRRFFANPLQADPNDHTVWPVPLLSSSLPDAELLTERSSEFVAQPTDHHMLNEGGNGFYHVRYDPKTLASLSYAVSQGKLGAVDRQRLLFDSIALNRAGIEPTIDTLRLLSHFDKEDNYSVWLAINATTSHLRMLVNDDPAIKPDLQRFIANLTRAEYERLGWEIKKNELHFDTLLRPFVIGNMAYAEDPKVTATCLEIFKAAKKPEDIMSDIRGIVYSTAVREQGEPVVHKLLGWYRTTLSADERVNIVAGISSMKSEMLAKKTLKLVTTKQVKLQDSFYWFIYFIRSQHTRMATWEWMKDHWEWIIKNFGGDHDYGFFPKYTAAAFSTREQLAMYKKFFEPKLAEAALARTIQQGFEDIETKALWRERDLDAIADYLKKD